MPRRTILTERQRAALFDLPTDEAAITRHYTLSEEDVALIRRRHRARNRLGFALQLCAFRYPGRLLQRGELIPRTMLSFVAAQLGLDPDEVADYAVRGTTRYQHSAALQEAYGFRPFAGAARRDLEDWLAPRAEDARTNLELAAAMLEACRRRRLIVPAASTIERACASALVEAERRIARRIVERLPRSTRQHILQKLQAYPRRTSLALALREVGRIERTLFTLDWLQDIGLRRRAQIGLNKGEARHALARALFFNRLGELRDRGREPQSHKASGLNLLTAAIVLWNTAYLEKAVAALRGRGQLIPDELLAHISPLAWEHIGLTGEYSWRSAIETSLDALRPLRVRSFADPKW